MFTEARHGQEVLIYRPANPLHPTTVLSHNPNLFPKPHSMIAEACLIYLNFRHVMGFSPGHEGVVRVFLGRNDVNPDLADKRSRTPLLWAARNGHEAVVKIPLKWDDIDPNQPDKLSRKPLSHAAKKGHEGVVMELLERNDVNLGNADQWSRTPLSLAVENEHTAVAEPLQEPRDLIPKHMISLQSAELFSPAPSEISEPRSKRARWF